MEPLITVMRRMIAASLDDPDTHLALRMILANDSSPAPEAIWNWARNDVRFHDEWPQVVASLPKLLQAPVGDCNDLAVAVASLLAAARIPVRFALGFDDSGRPRHIWAQAYRNGWIHVDPSPQAPPPGTTAPTEVINATISDWEPIAI